MLCHLQKYEERYEHEGGRPEQLSVVSAFVAVSLPLHIVCYSSTPRRLSLAFCTRDIFCIVVPFFIAIYKC